MAEEEVIPAYLKKIDVGFDKSEGGYFDYEYVQFRYNGQNGVVDCQVHYVEGGLVYIVFAMTQDDYDSKYRAEVLEYANRANQISQFAFMVVGSVEKKDDGSEKFSTWVKLSNADADTPSEVVIEAMIRNSCSMVSDYYPGLMKIVWGGMSANDALDLVLSKEDEDRDNKPPPPISGYQ